MTPSNARLLKRSKAIPSNHFIVWSNFKDRQYFATRWQTSCVPSVLPCHNTSPTSPKTDWKVGDVRGVLTLTRSLNPTVILAQSGLQGALGLMASLAHAAAMDEASPLGIFVTDVDGRCQHVNQMYQKITGYSAETMTGAALIRSHAVARQKLLLIKYPR